MTRWLEVSSCFVVLAAAVIVVARVVSASKPGSLAALVVATASLAWVLRQWVSPHGPGDIHLDGTSSFYMPSLYNRFGATLGALGNVARRFGPTDFGVLISLNAAFGAAASALLVAAFAPMDRLIGVSAGLLLATLPIALRFGADLSAMGVVLFFSAASLLAVAEALDAPTRSRAVLGCAMLACALQLLAQTRPEAVIGLGVVALAVVALPSVSRTRRGAVAGAFVLAALVVLRYWRAPQGALHFNRGHYLAEHWAKGVLALSSESVPTAFPILIAAAARPWAGIHAARLRAWCLASAIASGAMTVLEMGHFFDDRLSSARYHFAFVPALCVAAGCGVASVHAVGRRIGGAWGAVVAVIAVAAWLCVGTVRVTRAVVRARGSDEEYAFLRGALRAVPDGATIGFIPRGLVDCPMDVGFSNLDSISQDLRRWHRWVALGENVASPRVDYVYRGPRCDADWDRLTIRQLGCNVQTRALVERACAQARALEGVTVARRDRVRMHPIAQDYTVGNVTTLLLSRAP